MGTIGNLKHICEGYDLVCYRLNSFEEVRRTRPAVHCSYRRTHQEEIKSSGAFASASTSTVSTSSAQPTHSSHLFPLKSIFCKKEMKLIRDKITLKYVKEPLQKCDFLTESKQLICAAEYKHDADLL